MKYWIDSHPVGGERHCGDFVNYWQLAPHRHAIIVGDVAGRGVEVGDAAVALRARVHDLVISPLPLTTIVRIVSDVFTRTLMKESIPFASLFIALLDGRNGVMRYASAGHEPGFVFSENGTHRHLDPTGPVLGGGATPVFGERVVQLQPADVLVVVTDGVTEARRDTGDRLDFFGSRGVVRVVLSAIREGRDPARSVCSAAIEHATGRLADDVSAVVSSLPSINAEALQVAQEVLR